MISLSARSYRLSSRLCTNSVAWASKRCLGGVECRSSAVLWVYSRNNYNNNNDARVKPVCAQRASSVRGYAQHPTPDAASRNRLMWLVYFSGFMGAFMLFAVVRREFKKYQKKKRGIVEMKIPAFGHRIFICKYKDFVLFDTVGQNIEELQKFAVREDDVWLVGWPRSGTTWSQEIIYLVQTGLDFEGAGSAPLDDRFPYLEFLYPGYEAIAKYPSPRLIKSHLPFHLLPADIHVKKPKIIYIARNPKDIIVSYYHFIRMLLPFRFTGQFPEFFNLFLNDQLPYSPWWKHVLEFWEHRNEDYILFIKYEDLQKDLRGVIREISQFLGKNLTEEQVDAIAEHCTFDKMKTNDCVNHTWFENLGLKRKGEADFIRKGKIGDWKNYMTAEMSRRVDKMVEQKLGDTDLNFNFLSNEE